MRMAEHAMPLKDQAVLYVHMYVARTYCWLEKNAWQKSFGFSHCVANINSTRNVNNKHTQSNAAQ